MQDVRVGDCLDVMAAMGPESVDAIVTDPPYALTSISKRFANSDEANEDYANRTVQINPYARLSKGGFMGKSWDAALPGPEVWAAALRVAKPGSHLLAFGGTRTYHRLTCAIEDAGWEIRDCLSWMYGSGFPKSHNGPWGGTALKPAWEPVVLARRPLVGTVAGNVERYGVGGLNVDGCRIHSGPSEGGASSGVSALGQGSGWNQHNNRTTAIDRSMASGRWPANVCLDELAAAMLDEQAGERGGGFGTANRNKSAGRYGDFSGADNGQTVGYGDSGGPSRFFYCAKASRREREAGLEGARHGQPVRWNKGGEWTNDTTPARNHHPTVKPIALMRWLCRLVTPVGGTILDPFAGSGTTGCAAALEGFEFIGIEKEAEYAEIARARIAHWSQQKGLPLDGGQ